MSGKGETRACVLFAPPVTHRQRNTNTHSCPHGAAPPLSSPAQPLTHCIVLDGAPTEDILWYLGYLIYNSNLLQQRVTSATGFGRKSKQQDHCLEIFHI